jgi:UDP-N-acetylglucosamine 4-epimerase
MTTRDLQETLRGAPCTWLVTGVAGFIGSNLLESLLKLDQTVIGLDNLATGSHDNLRQVRAAVAGRQWARFHFIHGDIRALGTCRQACRGANYVLHQAALASVPFSIADPIASHETNVSGFVNLLVAAREAGVSRFVFAGSSASYGDDPGLQKVEAQIGRPLSPYGLSKYVDELYAEIFARCYGLEWIGLRYFNVFGPRQDPNGAYAAVIPKWIAAMIRAEPICIYGDGETVRDFCYVDNVVQANLLAALAESPDAVNQVYNVAMGEKTTLNQLFDEIRFLLEPRFPHVRELTPQHDDFRAGDVRISQADISRAQRFLGYHPEWQVREGLARTTGWYAERIARTDGKGIAFPRLLSPPSGALRAGTHELGQRG